MYDSTTAKNDAQFIINMKWLHKKTGLSFEVLRALVTDGLDLDYAFFLTSGDRPVFEGVSSPTLKNRSCGSTNGNDPVNKDPTAWDLHDIVDFGLSDDIHLDMLDEDRDL